MTTMTTTTWMGDDMTKKKNDVESVLDMLVHIADENVKDRRALAPNKGLTAADIERIEWAAVEAKKRRRAEILGSDLCEDDDEGDMLMELVDVLTGSRTPLTTWELVQSLQSRRLLSHQFPAAARQQCLTLLGRLRVANKVWQDPHGRWALL
jgi:hypothetical protein